MSAPQMAWLAAEVLRLREREAALQADNARLVDALSSIRQYCNDTFSGPTTGPLDAKWYRAAVIASRDRARNAMEGRKWNENEDGSDGSNPGAINWRDDPAAIVEDDEPQIGRDYA